jgi:transcriptional/translational regulatory protein YebC/TACO1
MEKARAEFMPKDSIERAIKKGTGELGGGSLEELTYEGIGPGGISFLAEVLTDNRNRTAGEIRSLVEKKGGSLGKAGSVSWKFERRGVIEIARETISEDALFELALEAGAENISTQAERHQVLTRPDELESVRQALETALLARLPRKPKAWGEEADDAPLFLRVELSWIPKDMLPLDAENTAKAVDFLEAIEDHDDVQNLWTDLEAPVDTESK